MNHTVEALAALVGGTIEGDGTISVTRAVPISSAGPGDITFLEDARHARRLLESKASAAVVGIDFQLPVSMPIIRVTKPLEAFGQIADLFRGPKRQPALGVHPKACIATTATIGEDVSIGPFVVVGEDSVIGDRCRFMAGVVIGDGCQIGNDVVIYPNAVLYEDTVLGDRVIVHSGVVLGADGFGYRTEGGVHGKVPQRGRVVIGDDVEIGANTTVDRATFQVTEVGSGTKIDNLVQIAHNCQIGRHNLIVSQVGLAGSCKTGDYVIIAGQAGIKDHITIGDGAILEGMSGVMENVPAGEKWVGIPATPARDQFRLIGLIRKLPEMRERLHQLTKQVDELCENANLKKKSA